MSTVLGIDQSLTSTGICIVEDGKLIRHEIIATKKTDDEFDVFFRSLEIAKQIVFIAHWQEVDYIVIEGLAFGMRGSATRDLGALQGIIMSELIKSDFHMDYVKFVAPTSLKKFATGSGKAKKEEMFDKLPKDVKDIFEKYPKTKGRFDLTDAYFLATYLS